MKIFILSILFLLSITIVSAQWTSGNGRNIYYYGGNVGIGVSNPSSALDIDGDIRLRGDLSRFIEFIGTFSDLTLGVDVLGAEAGLVDIEDDTYIAVKLYQENAYAYGGGSGYDSPIIVKNGKVGIGGVSDPQSTLDVAGDLSLSGIFKLGNPTMDPTPTGVMYVNGSAYFTEVNVRANGTWPDYVFRKNYELLPLLEVEDFITKNEHLPEVPSAQEVEEDGIDVAEMNMILLKKVEELTLYLIDQNKKIEKLEAKVDALSSHK